MSSLIYTLAAFLVAVLLLVSLHELGHLITARLCGIKVLRFSVGFGKPLLSRRWRGIEWCLAPIPLGGYVKMADTREGNVPPADRPFAFDQQHPAKRMAVVAAGPLTNLVLAVLLYVAVFQLYGVEQVKPLVGTVERFSLAERSGFRAGDTVVSVNGEAVASWGDFQAAVLLDMEVAPVQVAVRGTDGTDRMLSVAAAGTPDAAAAARRGGYFGLLPWRVTPVLEEIVPDSPAARAGLQTGDRLTAVGGETVAGWQDVSAAIRSRPQERLAVDFVRDGRPMQTFLRPESRTDRDGEIYGYAGFSGSPDEIWKQAVVYREHPSVWQSAELGWRRVGDYTALTFRLIGRLLTGQASVQHLSGPVSIADYAGRSASVGLAAYLEFLAVVSISLGILNLLPIPVLDGGHLMYYAAEWIRGKPVSERMQMLGIRVGMTLMLMLMVIAFFNDINRLFG